MFKLAFFRPEVCDYGPDYYLTIRKSMYELKYPVIQPSRVDLVVQTRMLLFHTSPHITSAKRRKTRKTTFVSAPMPIFLAGWWGRGYGVLARQQSVQYRTERSRTGSLEDLTNSQFTTIPDNAGRCVDPKTTEYPPKGIRSS